MLDGKPVLEFQPAIDLATGRLLGFEALLRWDHPSRGYIPPSVLIPWAEANNHIFDLNAWVLTEACRQAAEWPSGIQVAVNCSPVQLRHHQASVAAARALQSTGINPDRLTVEITESSVAEESAGEDLRALSRLGVHLAVDDVGTSWSTLENLRHFAIETAKIDRAFISALEPHEGMNRAIVEAIIHVSHSLAMSTVAEGVETAQQVVTLREFGADVAQGFFFARPLGSDETHALASTEPRPVFALGARDDSQGTTPVQPRPLTLLPGEPRSPVERAGSSGDHSAAGASPR
ncbi:MAG: EAL domain-containing protein [Acidimicrobiales bacterium]